jgi:hypothetical protein
MKVATNLAVEKCMSKDGLDACGDHGFASEESI